MVLTQQLVGQHVELLLVQASLGDGRELPAENLGQLRPLGGRRGEEELQVLGEREEGQRQEELVMMTTEEEVVLTLGSLVSMLYQRMEAQPLGSWQTLEMTTRGMAMAWNADRPVSTGQTGRGGAFPWGRGRGGGSPPA